MSLIDAPHGRRPSCCGAVLVLASLIFVGAVSYAAGVRSGGRRTPAMLLSQAASQCDPDAVRRAA